MDVPRPLPCALGSGELVGGRTTSRLSSCLCARVNDAARDHPDQPGHGRIAPWGGEIVPPRVEDSGVVDGTCRVRLFLERDPERRAWMSVLRGFGVQPRR